MTVANFLVTIKLCDDISEMNILTFSIKLDQEEVSDNF